MLTPQLNSKFVTKILTAPNGDTYRVLFLVSIVDGAPKAQIISAERIASPSTSTTTSTPCLPAIASAVRHSFPHIVGQTRDVFSVQFLDFFMSQPTRAPSL